MKLTSINPANGQVIAEYPAHSPEQVEEILQKVQHTYRLWHRTSFSDRARSMRNLARLLRERKETLASLMTEEMGKLLREGRAEIEKCAWVCEYFADRAEGFLQNELVETEARKSYVTFQPLGVILAVMPWNFPFWQVFRFAAPALMAGNTAVLKHASNVCGCALAIEELFRSAGFPPDVFRTLLIPSSAVEAVIRHPVVQAVTLTGSTPAGKAVAAAAGSVIKKTVLELGGSDPYLVLEDADLEATVNTCVTSRLINSGQSCIAAKRFIVVESIREAFERKFVEQMAARKMGDPRAPETDVGPLARLDLRDELHRQVTESIEKGALCLLGGTLPEGPGAFYPPTVLTQVAPGQPAYEEELFGPVAAIIPVADERSAIEVANSSRFGLGAAVFTRDLTRGERIAAQELNAGCCFVNDFVRSDPRLPFGGVKESGYGRELSYYGIKEFVNIKTVYIK